MSDSNNNNNNNSNNNNNNNNNNNSGNDDNKQLFTDSTITRLNPPPTPPPPPYDDNLTSDIVSSTPPPPNIVTNFPNDNNNNNSRGSISRAANIYMDTKSIKELQELNETRKRMLDAKEKQIEQLRQQVASGPLQAKINSLQLETRQLHNELNDSNNKLKNAEETITYQNLQLNELKSLREDIINLKEQNDELVKQHNIEMQKVLNENKHLEQQILRKEAQEVEYEKNMEHLKTSLNDMSRLRDELQQFREGVQIKSLEVENEKLRQHISQLENENKNVSSETRMDENQQKFVETLRQEIQNLQETNGDLTKRLSDIKTRENHLQESALNSQKVIENMKHRMKLYEKKYNLEDAMLEIKELNRKFEQQEKDNIAMKDQINDQQRSMQRLIREKRVLCKKAGVAETFHLTDEELNMDSSGEVSKLKSEIEGYKRLIKDLESERTRLTDDLWKARVQHTEGGMKWYGLTAEQTDLLQSYITRLRSGEMDTLRTEEQRHQTMKQEIIRLKSELEDSHKALHKLNDKLEQSQTNPMNDKQYDQILKALRDIQSTGTSKEQKNDDNTTRMKTNTENNNDDTSMNDINELMDLIKTLSNDKRKKWINIIRKEQEFSKGDNSMIEWANELQMIGVQNSSNNVVHADGWWMEGCMRDLMETQAALHIANDSLYEYQRRFKLLIGVQQQLYHEHERLKSTWNAEKLQLENQVDDLKRELAMVDKVDKVDNKKQKKELKQSERERLQREIVILKVEHQILVRNHNALIAENELFNEREAKHKKEMSEMNHIYRERISILKEGRDKAQISASNLAEKMLSMVPRDIVVRLSRSHQLLRQTHAHLLSKVANDAIRLATVEHLQIENKKLQRKIQILHDRLDEADSKATILNQELERYRHQKKQTTSKSTKKSKANDLDVNVLLRKLTSMETRELDAKKRIDRLKQQLTGTIASLDEAEKQLAEKSGEIIKMQERDIETTRTLVELQNRTESTITHREANELHETIKKLETENGRLLAERNRYMTSADAASRAAKFVTNQTDLGASENAELRNALRDFEQKSDQAFIVGKLELQKIRARVKAKEAENKMSDFKDEVLRIEATNLRLEQELQSRNEEYLLALNDYRHKLAGRDRLIVKLQEQVSVGMTLEQAEALYSTNARLTAKLQDERSTRESQSEEIQKLKDELASLSVKVQSNERLEGLLNSLDLENENNKKLSLKQEIVKWHSEVREMKVKDLQQQNRLRHYERKIEYLTSSNTEAEQLLGQLQQQLMEKDEYLQERELDFKRQLTELESREKILNRRERLLEKAVLIKKNDKNSNNNKDNDPDVINTAQNVMISDLKERCEGAEKQLDEYKYAIQQLQTQLRLITEQRNNERIINEKAIKSREDERDRIMATAQRTMVDLQKALELKEQDLRLYQEMVEKTVAKYRAFQVLDEQEISKLETKILQSENRHTSKLHDALKFLQEMHSGVGAEGFVPIEQVELMMHDKDNEIIALGKEADVLQAQLRTTLDKYHQEIFKNEELVRQYQLAAEKMSEAELNRTIEDLRTELSAKDVKVVQLENVINQLKADLAIPQSDYSKELQDTMITTAEVKAQLERERIKWRRRVQSLQKKIKEENKTIDDLKLVQKSSDHLNRQIQRLSEQLKKKDQVINEVLNEYRRATGQQLILKNLRKSNHIKPSLDNNNDDIIHVQTTNEPLHPPATMFDVLLKSQQVKSSPLPRRSNTQSVESKYSRNDELKHMSSNKNTMADIVLNVNQKSNKSYRQRNSPNTSSNFADLVTGLVSPKSNIVSTSSNNQRSTNNFNNVSMADVVNAVKSPTKDNSFRQRSKSPLSMADVVQEAKYVNANKENERQNRFKQLESSVDRLKRDRKRREPLRRDKHGLLILSPAEKWEEYIRMERKMKSLNRKYKNSMKEVKTLKQENSELKTKFGDLSVASEEMEQKMIELQNNLRDKTEDPFLHALRSLGLEGSHLKALPLSYSETLESVRRKLLNTQEEMARIEDRVEVELKTRILRLEKENEQLRRRLLKYMSNVDIDDNEVFERAIEKEVEALQQQLLDVTCEKMELNFECEQRSAENERLKKRIADMIQQMHSLRQHKLKHAWSDVNDKEENLKFEDMNRAVITLRNVVKKLKADNDRLRNERPPTPPLPSSRHNEEIIALSKEVKILRKRNRQLLEKKGNEMAKDEAQAHLEITKLNNSLKQARKMQRKEANVNAKLNEALHALKIKLSETEQDVQIKEKENVNLKQQLPKAQRQTRLLREKDDKIKSLQKQVTLLKQNLKRKSESCVQLENELQSYRNNVDYSKSQAPRSERVSSELTRLYEENDNLRQDVVELEKRLKDYSPIQTSNSNEEYQSIIEELTKENEALREELSAFDVSFFDEIEDLKYRYHQNLQLLERMQLENDQLREEIRQYQE